MMGVQYLYAFFDEILISHQEKKVPDDAHHQAPTQAMLELRAEPMVYYLPRFRNLIHSTTLQEPSPINTAITTPILSNPTS